MKKNQKQQTVICKEHQHETAGKKLINSANGITLIALVITIIVLLILARSNNCNANRAEWNTN